MPLILTRKSEIQFEVTSDPKGFSANINMNPRDRMVFVEVTTSSEGRAGEQLKELLKMLEGKFGGKIILSVPASLEVAAKAVGLGASTAEVSVIPASSLPANMKNIEASLIKNGVKTGEDLRRLEDDGYTFIRLCGEEIDQLQLYDDVYKFKEKNATFVTVKKKTDGVYSATAEREKSKLSSVHHFILKDRNKAVAATCMFAFSESGLIAYVSDIIVHEDLRGKRLVQRFFLRSYEELFSSYSNLSVVCVIRGGQGKEFNGNRLYEKFSGAGVEKADTKSEHPTPILLAMFGKAKGYLTRAANCDPEDVYSLDASVKDEVPEVKKEDSKQSESSAPALKERDRQQPSPVLSHSVTFPQKDSVQVTEGSLLPNITPPAESSEGTPDTPVIPGSTS